MIEAGAAVWLSFLLLHVSVLPAAAGFQWGLAGHSENESLSLIIYCNTCRIIMATNMTTNYPWNWL